MRIVPLAHSRQRSHTGTTRATVARSAVPPRLPGAAYHIVGVNPSLSACGCSGPHPAGSTEAVWSYHPFFRLAPR